ncbi:MAG: NAD-dependent epimerase/dehydratase family protein [Sulfurimicrobium sp.]|nr:NAD-dependent epimerase/dehydratase family protein [Sulfurimicrobium sp.]MDP1703318.1 NAD-dependent epimerase/dehydratase family protein [Sulfurimicrobium sp.]MDP2197333.1 NAD-dependent epimerase/dehydratase family protein [Sulfurimicrobium sp.]MDP3688446.1 NAD-dependent epimerase/dehydratase family protein [Sulfurimicrobium sp.]MDZ7657312.1 NAD-dependent epimerase/dehydratase family protein [Sulfurimicrobium sp.]
MQKLLIVGYGDIGARAAALLSRRFRIYALARSAASAERMRTLDVTPVPGDLDQPATLGRLGGLADAVLHFAPPQRQGRSDLRTRNLLAALSQAKILPQRLVYISTTGVYGDCQGGEVDEIHPTRPTTARAIRRADAEAALRRWGKRNGVRVSILRVPGIYAAGRLPRERLENRIPALREEDDGYTNHIHGDDLARIAAAALARGRPNRVYNASDDAPMKMADYFDLVADHYQLERPRRISWQEAQQEISPGMLSYMSESRRILNRRIKLELKVKLQYPGVALGLALETASHRKGREGSQGQATG